MISQLELQPGVRGWLGQPWGGGVAPDVFLVPVFRGQQTQGFLPLAKLRLTVQESKSPFQARKVCGFPRLLCIFPLIFQMNDPLDPTFSFSAETHCFHQLGGRAVPSLLWQDSRGRAFVLFRESSTNSHTFTVSFLLVLEY